MSSDIFCFEDLFDDYSSSDLASFSDANLDFYSDPLCILPDSPTTEIIQQIFDEAHNHIIINPTIDAINHKNNNNFDERKSSSSHFDQIGPATFFSSSSPPSHKMQNLSLSQTPKEEEEDKLPGFQVLSNHWSSSSNGSSYVLGYSPSYGNHQSDNGGYDHSSAQAHAMQRSFSTKSLDGSKHEFFYGKSVEGKQLSHSPDNSFVYNYVRRACSTGDLTNLVGSDYKRSQSSSFSSSSLGNNGYCSSAEAPLKMGKYTADERRERIDRYRAKRSLRNFNKTIKYVCRKTLADNRPRVRGRFARNEDTTDNPNKIYEDGIWIEGLHGRSYEGEMMMSGGGGQYQYLNGFGHSNHFQYHG